MKDVWKINKKDTRDIEGLNKLKSDISRTVDWGKKKYEEKKGYVTIKVEKDKIDDVTKYMKRKGIKFFLRG